MENNNNTSIAPSLPSKSAAIVSRTGNVLGRRYAFGTYSASDLKASLKAQGVKGRELSRKVNEALRSEAAQRRVVLGAAVAELHNRGFAPDYVDVKAKGAAIRFVKIEPPKVSAKAASAASEAIAKMKAAGMSAEDILAALTAAAA